MTFCQYCFKLIPSGFALWWNQKTYHPDCCLEVAITDQKEKEEIMNCKRCEKHIVATCQVMWRGYPFHEDCLAKAIQEQHQPQKEEINDNQYSTFRDENFDSDYPDDYDPEDYYSEDDDENGTDENFIREDFAGDDFDDELARAIIADAPEYANRVVTIDPLPENSIIVAPRAIIHPPEGNGQLVADPVPKIGTGTLMIGTKGSRYVSRSELFDLPTPPATQTWQPVAHSDFVRRLLDGLWDRRMNVSDEKYAVSADGFRLYGLITLSDEYQGINYAVGLKNSNDKSTKLSLAVGYVVKVCTNGMINGEYQPLSAKHTAKFNLDDSLSLGIDRIKRSFLKLSAAIDRKREFQLTEGRAEELVYKAFMKYKLPVSLLSSVHKELFVAPSYEEFKTLNLWSLENSFTTAFKKLQPLSQFEATAKLARFIDACLN